MSCYLGLNDNCFDSFKFAFILIQGFLAFMGLAMIFAMIGLYLRRRQQQQDGEHDEEAPRFAEDKPPPSYEEVVQNPPAFEEISLF